ncbi:MAG TPA: HNH endonuclease [Terriglobales bacterium]|nr:HNH endonuclease [Terriglobales bacterium]
MLKSRASKGLLVTPRAVPNESEARRQKWLADAEAGFVTPHPVNKIYYSVILTALWPAGHGIPGPILSERDIRAAIDSFRAASGQTPYLDPFRRLRELQGDEGFTSIRKEGNRYQLQSLEVSPKREPRAKLSRAEWKKLKEQYDYRCASCGRQEPEVKLSPDHKVPRSRNGSNDLGNWQPLCEQCNIKKSSACQGCQLNCYVCSWAFPAEYKELVIADENKELIRRAAEKLKLPQSELVNKILRDHFNQTKP